tara:strand:+ start:381 stop:551 length:171 start_codon:yes stop_codon:yes gene_type:complete
MINYLLFGVIFTFLVDLASNHVKIKFDNWERLVVLLLWPLAIISFIHGYLKERFKK